MLVTAWAGDVQTDAAVVDLVAPDAGLVELRATRGAPSTADSVDVSYLAVATEAPSVRGRLRDAVTGAPIVDAVVSLRDRDRVAQSDPSGHFALGDIDAGPLELVIDHLAYGASTVTIDVPARQTAVATVWLSPRPIALDGVTVTTNRALEAARRRAPYRLTIFAGRELADAETRGARPIEVLRNAPGVRVRRDGSIELPRARCCAIFVLDGIRVDNPLAFMPLSDIESIEVLPPVEASWRYGLGGVEGAVVIFTRGKGPYRDPNRVPGG